MKQEVATERFKDHFSAHATDYAKFRPRYPEELFCYLAGIVLERKLAWDCATGNGQAAAALAALFEQVIATDASHEQIANAETHPRVNYCVVPAEDSGIASSTVDLISIAQALHWFDLDRFYLEAKRVLKAGGIIAAWAYNLLSIAPRLDVIVNHYYSNVVGAYWPPERLLVEKFDQLAFPFSEIIPPSFEMRTDWTLDQLVGYLRTWSATQRFITANKCDPLESIVEDLRSAWDVPAQRRQIVWPITLRIGHA